MPQQVRLAVVGLGKMGLSHHSMINAHPRVKVAAVATPPVMYSMCSTNIRVQTFTDFDAMLRDVAARRGDHRDAVEHARQDGQGCTRKGAARLLREAVLPRHPRGRRRQSSGHREEPRQSGRLPQPLRRRLREVKRLLDAKAIGEVTHAPRRNLRSGRTRSQGNVYGAISALGAAAALRCAAHPLNLVNWYLGTPTGVGGSVLNSIFSQETDDEVFGTLYFDGGKGARFRSTGRQRSYRKMSTKITIWGTNGRIYVDRQECGRTCAKCPPVSTAIRKAGTSATRPI